MTILKRMQQLAKMNRKDLGNLSVSDRLQLNSLSLEVMGALQRLGKMEEWLLFEDEVRKDIEKQKRKIASLALDPEKNKYDLVANATAVDILQTLLHRVSKAGAKEGYLREEQKQLVEAMKS